MTSNKPQRSDCMVPFCRNKKPKRNPSQVKPMGAGQVEKHNKKFGKLK